MAGNPDPKQGALFGDRNFRWGSKFVCNATPNDDAVAND
jgi:hypothetical protein